MRIKGIQVTLYEQTQNGTDSFGAPVWDEAPVAVDNVLVSPVSTEAQVNAAPAELYGRRELYQIAVPKGDSHRWSNCRVSFFGKMWRVIGGEKRGIESSIPLLWNAIYTVEAIDE